MLPQSIGYKSVPEILSTPRPAVFIAGLVLLFGSALASGAALEDRDWIEVRSENFRIRSILKEKDTIKLACHLEMFRIAVTALTNVRSTEAPIPIYIYSVRSPADIASLGFEEDVSESDH